MWDSGAAGWSTEDRSNTNLRPDIHSKDTVPCIVGNPESAGKSMVTRQSPRNGSNAFSSPSPAMAALSLIASPVGKWQGHGAAHRLLSVRGLGVRPVPARVRVEMGGPVMGAKNKGGRETRKPK